MVHKQTSLPRLPFTSAATISKIMKKGKAPGPLNLALESILLLNNQNKFDMLMIVDLSLK